MKNAYIITNSEMVAILKQHLAKEGYKTNRLTVRFTSTNAVVAGIEKATTVPHLSAPESNYEDEDYDDEDEEDYEDEGANDALIEQVRGKITFEPMTIAALAMALSTSSYAVRDALSSLGARSVAPARENGSTVSMWMLPNTEEYEQFVAKETARVEQRVEETSDLLLSCVPKFYEPGGERPKIVEKACEKLTNDDEREALRRDARAIFYRMGDLGRLEHEDSTWRASQTEADHTNVTSLQGAVREVLMASDLGLSYQGVSEKLPGFVDHGLLCYAIEQMGDVYEQGGLLHHSK